VSSATETCSCGAKIELTGHGSDTSVSRTLASWRTTHRHTEPSSDPKLPSMKDERPEHLPDGNNFASTERGRDFTPHELDAESRPGPYGRGISLKWRPNDG